MNRRANATAASPAESASSGSDAIQRKRAVYRVTIVGMVTNLLLVVAKLAAGIIGRSAAMVADAVHSISDFATDVIVIVFVGASARPRDETHDYGHGKFETLGTVAIGVSLVAVGAGILVSAIEAIVAYARGGTIERPHFVALGAAAVSVVVKELLFRLTRRVGTREASPAVIANAWHHRSDALSSVGALVGIGGALLLGGQWHVLDPIAAIVVSVLIGKAAVGMIVPGLRELLEASLPLETEREIMDIVRGVEGVEDPHNLRTRRVGTEIAMDVHVRMDRTLSVEASHRATEAVENRIRERFGTGTMVSVHVEPSHRMDDGTRVS